MRQVQRKKKRVKRKKGKNSEKKGKSVEKGKKRAAGRGPPPISTNLHTIKLWNSALEGNKGKNENRTVHARVRSYARAHARTHTIIIARIARYVLINACVRMYLYAEPFVNKRVCRDRGKRVDRGESRKRVIPRGWFVKRNRDREIEREGESERKRARKRKRDDRGDGEDGKEKRGKTETQRKTALCVTKGKKILD